MSTTVKFGFGLSVVIDNFVTVSPSFLNKPTQHQFQTIKAALAYVTAQVPTESSRWCIYIYSGLYLEERGTFVDSVTESSLIVPDYCYLKGVERDSVVIEPDSNVPGEKMSLFAMVQEGDQDPLLESHTGFSNLTIRNCLYGDGIQVDSFIKKTQGYPEFRCHIDNVRVEDCSTGLKVEERNSRLFISDIFIRNCDIGIEADDAKVFGSNVIIRQSGATKLKYGIYSQDKKAKFQIFGIDIGVDWDGLDSAYDSGVRVSDKGEVHVYSCRVDNAERAVDVTESGEFKGWGVKFHDSGPYNIYMQDDGSKVEIFNGELDGQIYATNDVDLHLRNATVDAHKHDSHAIEWNSDGKLIIGNAIIKSAGKKGAINYRCIHMTNAPSEFVAVNSFLRYDHDNGAPDYLINSTIPVTADIRNCSMEVGMHGNIRILTSTKQIGSGVDCYASIQDAIDSATSGDTALVSPGTYNEQITMKGGVKLSGTDKETCILERTELPINWNQGVYVVIENMHIKTSVQGNDIARPTYGVIRFNNCLITNGTINIDGNNMAGNVGMQFKDCFLVSNGAATYNILTTGDSTWKWCSLQAWDTEIGEESGGISWNLQRSGSGWGNTFNLTNCILSFGEIIVNQDANPTVLGGTYYSEKPGGVFKLDTSKEVKFSGVFFRGGNEMVKFTKNPSAFQFINNLCANTWQAHDIDSTVDITNAKVFGNVMSKGLSGRIQTTNALKNVAGGQDFYTKIQNAIDAANTGDLIEISPGTYVEQLTAKAGITVSGLDASACILQNTGVDAATYPLADVTDIGFKIKNLTIKTTLANNTIHRFGGTTGGYSGSSFENCYFTQGRFLDRNSTGHQGQTFTDCNFEGDVHGFNLTGAVVGKNNFITFNTCYFFCSPIFNSTHSLGLAGVNFYDGCTFEPANSLTVGGDWAFKSKRSEICAESRLAFSSTSREFSAEDSVFNGGINFTSNPSATTMKNCTFQSIAVGLGDIIASVNVTSVLYTGNIQQNGIDGEVQITSSTKNVGGGIDCYRNIVEAIKAASSGSLISIAPGTYDEQVTLKTGVTLKGFDRDTTILQQSADPILFDGSYAGSSLEAMTIQVTTPGNRIIDFKRNCLKIFNSLIKNGYLAMDNVTTNTWFELHDCILSPPAGGGDVVTIKDTSASWSYIMMNAFDTRFDGNIYFKTLKGKLRLNRCMGWSNIIFEASAPNGFNDVIMDGCEFTFDGGDILTVKKSGTGTVDEVTLKNCLFDGDGANNGVRFSVAPAKLTATGCTMRNAPGGKFDILVDAGVNIPAVKLISNIMTTGIGGDGIFTTANPVKYVDGGVDCYATVQHALNGIVSDNQIIELKANQAITAALTPPSYEIKIDGLHQFSITRGAGNPLMTLGDNDKVKFVAVDLVGSIDVNGNGAKLFLADHTYLKGLVDIIGGDANTEIRLDQCRVEGDASDQYCIRVRDADPLVVIKRSHLKGDAGDEAIYFDVVNNSLKIGNATIMHGSLAANSPINKGGAVGNINLASHHNSYNAAWAAGFTNLIGAGQQFDSFDPDGDF